MSRFRIDQPRLYIQAVFALAAALALSTTACANKHGANSAPNSLETTAVDPVKPEEKTWEPGKSEKPETEVEMEVEVERADGTVTTMPVKSSGVVATVPLPPSPPPIPESVPVVVPASVPAPAPQVPAQASEQAPFPIATQLPSNKAVITEVAPSQTVESVVYFDPSGLTRDQIIARKDKVDGAGPTLGELVRSDIVSGDGQNLYYTGAAQDKLRSYLFVMVNERLAKVDAETRAGDKALAQTIQVANFNVDWPSRRAELSFRLMRPDDKGVMKMTKIFIKGQLDGLAKFKVGNLDKEPFVAAEVACMDISGGCKTAHIRVQDRGSGKVQTAHMIARQTNAAMDIDGTKQVGQSGNPEYDRLMSVFVNTARNPTGENVVDRVTLTTSETIGGASNFSLNMRIRLQDKFGRRGGDVIELTGPLVKPREGHLLDISANVTPQLTVSRNEIVPPSAGVMSRFVESISDVRITKNNGLGVLQFDLTIRNSSPDGSPETITLMFARIHTPVGPLRLPME